MGSTASSVYFGLSPMWVPTAILLATNVVIVSRDARVMPR